MHTNPKHPKHPVIVLTRETGDNLLLADPLNAFGIDIIQYPCIRTALLPFGEKSFLPPPAQLSDFKIIVFTSKRGVAGMASASRFFDRLNRLNHSNQIIAVVGQTTAGAVRTILRCEPSIIADPSTSETLAHTLVQKFSSSTNSTSILHVRGNKSTGRFKTIMTDNGFPVTDLEVYRNENPETKPPIELENAVVLLASPSAARFFFQSNPGDRARSWTYLAIGPTTARYLKKMELPYIVEAQDTGIEILVEKLRELIAE